MSLKLNVGSLTVKTLRDFVLKEQFGMVAPDVEIEDGKGGGGCGFMVAHSLHSPVSLLSVPGTILLSSEEGETEGEERVWVVLWWRWTCVCCVGWWMGVMQC